MTERPILFNGDMVRAILDGRKTQTRRPIKPQPGFWRTYAYAGENDRDGQMVFASDESCAVETIKMPCAVGDILWVRETWRPVMEAWRSFVEYRANGTVLDVHRDVMEVTIRKSGGALRFPGANQKYVNENWRPSIHMPRWACRTLLFVTDVRAERLDDISIGEMIAEGFDASEEMVSTWNGIYAKDGFGWDANPWVWAISFEPCTDQGTADV